MTKPVSVVAQVTVSPPPDDAVQEATLVGPVVKVGQVTSVRVLPVNPGIVELAVQLATSIGVAAAGALPPLKLLPEVVTPLSTVPIEEVTFPEPAGAMMRM